MVYAAGGGQPLGGMPRTGWITTFKARYSWMGPAIWIATLEYFVIQAIVAGAFLPAYDWAQNTISDLGNTRPCGEQQFCSPRYALMNTGLVILGLVMIAGAILTHQEFNDRRRARWGFLSMASAGLGATVVGFAPENVHHTLHLVAAFVAIGFGNLALVIFACRLTELNLPFRIPHGGRRLDRRSRMPAVRLSGLRRREGRHRTDRRIPGHRLAVGVRRLRVRESLHEVAQTTDPSPGRGPEQGTRRSDRHSPTSAGSS